MLVKEIFKYVMDAKLEGFGVGVGNIRPLYCFDLVNRSMIGKKKKKQGRGRV